MSASQASVLTAVAFQLAASLEAYETEVERLAAWKTDPELYLAVSRRMDELRMYAAGLPQLSVGWVEVMIRHFEITHCLWRMERGEMDAQDLHEVREHQRQAVRTLHGQCLKLIAQG